MESKWTFEGKPVDTLPEHTYGFVYKIFYSSGQSYIGQKTACSRTTVPALLNGVVRQNAERILKRKPLSVDELSTRTKAQIRTNVKTKLVPFDIVTKETKWQSYNGSSKNTTNLTIVSREILEFAPTKRSLTYLEAKYLFCTDAIIDENSLNDNILGKFYRGSLL